jgi:two-component system chemotaxis sensor kinase CheA
VELVRREQRAGKQVVEMIHGAPVYRLRGGLLPLVYARTAFESASVEAHRDEALHIVVLRADDRTFGLVVDEINDTEEIVVKPLGKQLKGITTFAGATIMGDGRVALIIDVLGLAQRAHVISEVRGTNRVEPVKLARSGAGNRQTLLVCGMGGTRRAAIPLSSIARLEEFPADSIEHAGQYDVVQYRGQIMPLLDLPNLLGFSSEAEPGRMVHVVVYSGHGRNIGFVVDRILDIVEVEIQMDLSTLREGMLGSIIIKEKVADVLDVAAIVRSAAPWLLEDTAAPEHAA